MNHSITRTDSNPPVTIWTAPEAKPEASRVVEPIRQERLAETPDRKEDAKGDRTPFQLPDRLLIAYFLLSPLYLLPSGMPQIGDWLIPLVAFLLFLKGDMRIRKETTGTFTLLLAFGAWTAVVSTFWFIRMNELTMIRAPAFYLFNVTAAYLLFARYRTNPARTLRLIGWGVGAAAFTTAAMLILNFNPLAVRQTGGFNNPNQLAYAGTLIAAISGLYFAYGKGRTWSVVGITVGSMFVALSMSLSAIGALAVLFVAIGVSAFRQGMFRALPRILLAAVAAGTLIWATPASDYLTGALDARMDRLDTKVEEAADIRGYDRIFEYPQSLLFGMGEGAEWRFGGPGTLELHSTVGALLFYYGIIGFTLLALALLRALWRSPLECWLLLGSVIVYGIAHQGLRFTWFWIFIAACLLLKVEAEKGRVHPVHGPTTDQ